MFIFVRYTEANLFFNFFLMEGYAKAVLVGNVTDEPQKIPTKTGNAMAVFSLAVNRVWKNKEGKYSTAVDFHKIVAFGRWAEYLCERVHKGVPLLVEGQMTTRSFENAEGKKQTRTEVKLQKLKFLGASKNGKKSSKPLEVSVEEPDASLVAA